MSALNQFVKALFGVLWAPFSGINPWWGIWFWSVAIGIVALIAMKYLSNQTRIVALKDKYKAHVLAIKLFRDDLGVVLKSLGKTLWNIFLYMGHNLRPMVVLMIPIVLLFAQMQMRLAYDPLEVGDKEYVYVDVKPEVDLTDRGSQVVLREVREHGTDEAVEGAVELYKKSTHAPERKRVVFPLEMKKEGAWDLVFQCGDEEVTKSVHVGDQGTLAMLSPVRSNGLMDLILYPTEEDFESESSFSRIGFTYPIKPLMAFGFDLSWGMELGMGIWFIILSILAAFALKGVFGVEF